MIAQFLSRSYATDWVAVQSDARWHELATLLDGAARIAVLLGPPGQGMGEVPDAEVARRLGVSSITVCRWRNELGIPAYGSKNGGGLRPRPWHDDLGKIPDNVIAKREGLSRTRVGDVRKKLGIPPAPLETWHVRARRLRPDSGFTPGHDKSPRKKSPEPEEGP